MRIVPFFPLTQLFVDSVKHRIFVALFTGASPSGKAAGFGSAIRWFESSRPSSKVAINKDGVNSEIKIVAGRSNPDFAQKIANAMYRELSAVTIRNFSDGELWVKYEENVRGVDLYIVQSTFAPSDNIMELLLLIDAAKRASARRITAVIPYFGYARQDRKDQPRVAITAKLIADLLTRAGAHRVIAMDLHTPQLQGFFDIPLDHLYASTVTVKGLKELGLDNLAVAAPDVGGVKAARAYATMLGGADLVVVDKRRPKHNVAEIMNIIGDVNGKNVIIVDDLIDTGSTFVKCAEALKAAGALKIVGSCTHAVFSGDAVKLISASDAIEKLYVTDTIPMREESNKIEIVSAAGLFSEAIIRTHENQSISSLFDKAQS